MDDAWMTYRIKEPGVLTYGPVCQYSCKPGVTVCVFSEAELLL
jgi:hypothetical protein